jgi:hypothetical protein
MECSKKFFQEPNSQSFFSKVDELLESSSWNIIYKSYENTTINLINTSCDLCISFSFQA